METKTALGAAGGVALTVVGAVSALTLLLGAGASAADDVQTSDNTVIEYVDENGNPVSIEEPTTAPEIIVTNEAPAMDESVEPGNEPMTASDEAEAEQGEAYGEPEEAEEGAYPEDELEEGEEDEYPEDELDEEGEYPEGEHEEDDD